MGDMEIGRCECCGAENVPLQRKYFRYHVKCECCSPEHFVMVRHCEDCEPKEPMETKITVKTEDLKNPFSYAFRIIKDEMQRTRDINGEIYSVWESGLAMMIYDSVPNMTADRANEIASSWLDMLFEIGETRKINC